ncbi:palmitoyl-monogalactosyldiacylglycerol delta-7 desaturase, chloroplastic-like [Bidens hawaiensis]|uniref:palmitoyl-monogalactosyldiacylglycerol delta-7 desaturase, chloroplastic-like n=1 Tax=Bidens hawaiensis TaxID=980011 RepID=UPI00404B8F62
MILKLKWYWLEETNVCWFMEMLLLGACAPFVYDPNAVQVSVALAFLSGYRVTLGYHRLLTHRGFKVPKLLEYFFAYCGAHALQRDPIVWVSTHKLHHKHADTLMDPNAPTKGVWLSYIGWFLYSDYVATKVSSVNIQDENANVMELEAQGFYRFLHDTYFWHPTALATLLYLYGGFSYLAWGMGMRITVLHLVTYIQNYVNHTSGERAWNTPDTSTNNWWVSMLSLGEGWHNNHHAFPKSARHGLEWWQFDLTWELIKFLMVVGLVKDVKVPTEVEKKRMASFGSNQK